ncbi:hypothetical protein B0H10DRAFT_1954525 [Mycena sp. CBHHK59/15]|nr:hypothetical protein B0H10DRAFT_1954525 [Mycena sp. CBHHK59/15]
MPPYKLSTSLTTPTSQQLLFCHTYFRSKWTSPPRRLVELLRLPLFPPKLVELGYYTADSAVVDKFMRWLGQSIQSSSSTPPSIPWNATLSVAPPPVLQASQALLPPSSPILSTSSPFPGWLKRSISSPAFEISDSDDDKLPPVPLLKRKRLSRVEPDPRPELSEQVGRGPGIPGQLGATIGK